VDPDTVTRLRRVIGRLARLLNDSSSSEDLSPTQASVLASVASRGPIGAAELAAIEGLNPTMLSRIVSKLDGAGLLRRFPNPTDLRAVNIEITDTGREVCRRIVEHRTQTVAKILESLPSHHTEALLTALPALEALADGLRTPPARS
jgi:DNA-binding MarR family transcriptional regulator